MTLNFGCHFIVTFEERVEVNTEVDNAGKYTL